MYSNIEEVETERMKKTKPKSKANFPDELHTKKKRTTFVG